MVRFPASRALLVAALTAAVGAQPAHTAILFQQTVTPTNGVASFNSNWLSTAPGKTWIGVDEGRLRTAQAMIGADYYGLFWYEVFDDSADGSHPELYEENYSTLLQCNNAIGSGACSSRFPLKTTLATRMTGSVFEIGWTGFIPFNNCHPFRGIYFEDCAFYGFQTTENEYRLRASASAPVTFTIYDADPTNGAIPEPASWALLIAGFGLTGAVLRGRRGFGLQPG